VANLRQRRATIHSNQAINTDAPVLWHQPCYICHFPLRVAARLPVNWPVPGDGMNALLPASVGASHLDALLDADTVAAAEAGAATKRGRARVPALQNASLTAAGGLLAEASSAGAGGALAHVSALRGQPIVLDRARLPPEYAAVSHASTPVLAAAAALGIAPADVAADPDACLLPLSEEVGRKRGRPRKHPDGYDGLGNRTEQTRSSGIYRITYKTGMRVWRVTVYWRRRNRYLGTYGSEIAGASCAAADAGAVRGVSGD